MTGFTDETLLSAWRTLAEKLTGGRPLESLARSVDGVRLPPLVTETTRVQVPPRVLTRPEIWAEQLHPGLPVDCVWLAGGAALERSPGSPAPIEAGDPESALFLESTSLRLVVDVADPLPWLERHGPWRHTFFGVHPGNLQAALDEVGGTDGRVFGVDALEVAEAGGEAPDILGGALWRAARGLRAAEAAGADVELLFRHAALRLPLGRDLPANIAMLRAARTLWSALQVGLGLAPIPVLLHAVGGVTTLARRDPWNNAVRATFEGASALLGGVDALTLRPYDRLLGGSDDGRRLALTTAAVLREEAWLNAVEDAAAGSYALEDATAQLVRDGWARFQALERAGVEDLGPVRARRESELARRRQVVVGVSDHAPATAGAAAEAEGVPAGAGDSFREGAQWEALAQRVRGAVVVLVPVGSAAGPRLEFSQRLFAAGGFRTVTVGSATVVPGAAGYVLCGADADLVDGVGGAAAALVGRTGFLVQAGAPGANEAAYRAAGVGGFFALGQDLLAFIHGLLGALAPHAVPPEVAR